MATPGRLHIARPSDPEGTWPDLAIFVTPWIAAIAVLVAGTTIFSGWTLNPTNSILDVTQQHPPQVGTALGLVLASFVLAATASRSQSALIKQLIGTASLLILLIGTLNVGKILLTQIGLKATHLLPAAPYASIGFIIFGGSILIAQATSSNPRKHYIRGVAGAITATLGTIAAIGHAFDMPIGYSWGTNPPLSVVGSIGIGIAGFGAMANVLRTDDSPRRRSFTFLALAILVSGLTASGLTGSALYTAQVVSEKQFVGLVANNVTRYLKRALQTDLLPLETMAAQWRTVGRIPEPEWRSQADLMLETMPGLRAVLWVDSNIVGRRVAPEDLPGVWTERQFDTPLLLEYGRRIMAGTEPSLYPVFDGQRGRSFSTLIPVYDKSVQDGLLLTVIDTNEWGEAVLSDVSRQANVRITDSIGIVYDNGVEGLPNGLQAEITVKVGEEQWLITATETQAMVDAISSLLPQTVTALGLILTLLLYASTLIAQTSMRRAKALTSSNTRLEMEVDARQAVQNRLEKEIRIRLDTEADLKKDREQLDLALGAGGTGTWHLNPETGELKWDARMVSLFGFDNESFDGSYDMFKSVVFKEDLPRVERAIARAWETGEEFEEDFRIHKSHNTVHVIYGKARVVTAPSGKYRIMIGINQDVTERRRAEKLSTLGALAAGFAHELNNPLMGCVNYVAYAHRKTENARARDAMEKAETEIKRVIRVVQDMLSFSRFKEDFSAEADIASAVNQAANLIATSYQSNGITFENLIDTNIGQAAISEDALEQVMLNLLVNAGHAVEGATTRKVTVRSEQDEKRIYISVTDSGAGIPDDIQARLFEPFFTTKKAGKGSGLGLSISLDIVKRFGGHLSFDTTAHLGTTFTIALSKAVAPNEGRRGEEV